MLNIFNQFRRIGNDYGQNDRDFTKEETRLQIARNNLDKALDEYKRAAEDLYDKLTASRNRLN